MSLRAVQATCNKGEGVPTVLKWPDQKAGKVCVEGTFTNWNRGIIELQRSNSEYIGLVYLQPGTHTFRYIVDGVEAVDDTQTKIEHEKGVFNTIVVHGHSVLSDSDDESLSSYTSSAQPKPYAKATTQEKERYSQCRWVFEETRKLPPIFPPHLRFTPLTSSPPEARPVAEHVLPTPYHVTINHTYFQARDSYNVLGATYRHQDKFSTVVYYRSQQVCRLSTASLIRRANNTHIQPSERDGLRTLHSDPASGTSGRQPIAAATGNADF